MGWTINEISRLYREGHSWRHYARDIVAFRFYEICSAPVRQQIRYVSVMSKTGSSIPMLHSHRHAVIKVLNKVA